MTWHHYKTSWHDMTLQDTLTSCSMGHSRTQGLPPHSPGPCSRSRWWAGGSHGIWTWWVVILSDGDPLPLLEALRVQHQVTNQCYFSSVMLERLATVTALLRSLHSTHCTQHCHYDKILCPWSQTCSRPVSSWLLMQIMWPSSSRKYSDSILLPQSLHLKHSGWNNFSLKWEMQALNIYSLNIFEKYFPCSEVLVCDRFTASITQKFFLYLLWNLPSSALKILSSRIWWPMIVPICSFQL